MSDRRFPKFLRRSQSGQSIIILAIGFLALLCFVGIVTDVSILFVRYSTLRRAVDAAAIAAAGQLRRAVDDAGQSENEIQSNSLANLNLAARSFIELYDLDPTNVLVETCYTQDLSLTTSSFGAYDRPVDRNNVPLYMYDANGVVSGENGGANPEDRDKYEELCTRDELKLVRVTAQIESPTVFLRLLGFQTVTLQESAISQTAVIDVALIIDVSESMTYDTGYTSYETQDPIDTRLDRDLNNDGTNDILDPEVYNRRYFPPQLPRGNDYFTTWDEYLNESQDAILADLPGVGSWSGVDTWVPAGQTASPTEIRTTCRIRFWPPSISNNLYRVSDSLVDNEYQPHIASGTGTYPASWYTFTTTGTSPNLNRYANGFVPAVDYYGCCNDPNGDGSFADLVCEPFKVVRESAENFLDRLDFVRGDRVAFVTFDRTARIVDPDGTGLQNPFIETLDNIDALDPNADRIGARQVLTTQVGVRAEPNFYIDVDGDGTWDGFRTVSPEAPRVNFDANQDGTVEAGEQVGFLDFTTAANFYDTTRTGLLFDSPVRESCFTDGAYTEWRYSLIDYYAPGAADYMNAYGQVYPTGISPDTRSRLENRRTDFSPDSTPLDQIASPSWIHSLTDFPSRERKMSYEYRAGCRGSNIASSLESASNAFYRFGRRQGAVWVMVMLSDGAAGGTDPVRRQYFDAGGSVVDEHAATPPQLYNDLGLVQFDFDGTPLVDGDGNSLQGWEVAPVPGEYGSYGLCPYGTSSTTGAGSNAELLTDQVFPYCSDEQPQSRNFCGAATENPRLRSINRQPAYTNANGLTCEQIYDADDYAHDWADFIGLANLDIAGATNQLGDERLPAIFTIGFGLKFADTRENPGCASLPSPSAERTNCNRQLNNAADYLGEELLRYIADVGDNNRLDNDYWQQLMSSPTARIPNLSTTDFGPSGECEQTTSAPGTWQPLPPGTSCGNYFVVQNTSDIDQLDSVFNQISSRMFTRLAQ